MSAKEKEKPSLRDPVLREQFARMRQGLNDAESAMRGLANELSAMLLQSDIDEGGELLERDKLIDRIYESIAHGDEQHRAWLRNELNKFKGQP